MRLYIHWKAKKSPTCFDRTNISHVFNFKFEFEKFNFVYIIEIVKKINFYFYNM